MQPVEQTHYQFVPDIPKKCENHSLFGDVNIIVTGESQNTSAQNQEAFGSFIAQHLADEIKRAQGEGKTVLLDLATGSTPKSVWEPLAELVEEGKLDLSSGVIITGHEEAFGSYEKGGASDFDDGRRKVAKQLGIAIQDITDPLQITDEHINGNFLPMHLIHIKREDFPEGSAGDQAYLAAELKAAQQSAEQYNTILRSLEQRPDVKMIGLYGVGTDGHIGECQINMQGIQPTLERLDAFVYEKEEDSIEKGLFLWQKEGTDGDFYPDNNIMWKRRLSEGQAFGRAQWQQGYGEGAYYFMGIGWLDMIKADHLILAFNNESKSLAFKLALEGSFNGTIVTNTNALQHIDRVKGEGEAILPDLKDYALTLEDQNILPTGTAQEILSLEDQPYKCDQFFRAIYNALDNCEASADDPQFTEIYRTMWSFANRYIGKRAPVARLLALRTLLGRDTTIVVTPEVIKETKYQALFV